MRVLRDAINTFVTSTPMADPRTGRLIDEFAAEYLDFLCEINVG